MKEKRDIIKNPLTLEELTSQLFYRAASTVHTITFLGTVPISIIVFIWFTIGVALKFFLTGLVLFITSMLIKKLFDTAFKVLLIAQEKKITENGQIQKT